MIADYPLGAGGYGFLYLSPNYLPARLIEARVGRRAPHNTYLLIVVEQGVVGAPIFIIFLVRLTKTSFLVKKQIIQATMQGKSHPNHTNLYMFSNAALAGLAGLLVAATFTDRLYYEGLYFLTAIFPAILHISTRELESCPLGSNLH